MTKNNKKTKKTYHKKTVISGRCEKVSWEGFSNRSQMNITRYIHAQNLSCMVGVDSSPMRPLLDSYYFGSEVKKTPNKENGVNDQSLLLPFRVEGVCIDSAWLLD